MAAFLNHRFRLDGEETKDETIAHLSAVDELSQGDVGMVAKDVDILEVGVGAVLESDAEEVADIRR